MAHFAGSSTTNFGGQNPSGTQANSFFVPEIYSKKVWIALRRASTVEATPIVPPSLIKMSSLNVTIPADETVIASTVEATPIVPPSFISM